MSVRKSRCALIRFQIEGLEPRMLLSATQLDPTFASNGSYQLGTLTHAAQSVEDTAVQPDGKILTLGDIHGDGIASIVVRRFNSDGSADTTFGTAGAETITDPANANDVTGAAMSLGPDGKIAIVGSDGADALVARLLPSGALDTGFASTGIATFSSLLPNHATGWPRAVMLSADDKTTYSVVNENYQRGQVSRLNADGTVDTTIDPNSLFLLNNSEFVCWALTPLPNGQFLAAGTSLRGMSVVKLNQDGTPDASFGTGGLAALSVTNAGYQQARSVAVQADGKIVLGGRSGSFYYEGNGDKAELVRFNPNGSLDTTFGTQGGEVLSYPTARELTVLPTGQIAVASEPSWNSVPRDIQLLMLNSSGKLDTSFNLTGAVDPAMTGFGTVVRPAGLAQSQGLPLLVGDDAQKNCVLARYTTSGTADASFGSAGRVTVASTAPGYDAATVIQPTSDGGVLVGGTTARDGNMLLKLTASGAPDPSFATGGVLPLPASPTLLALRNDGRIYVVVQSASILRLNSNGTPDTTWGTQGVVTLSVPVNFIAPDPTTGGLIVGGNLSFPQAIIERLTATGTVDTSFGTAPWAPGQTRVSGQVFAAAVQPDGRILLAGNGLFGVTRLNPDGTLDTSFGVNALAATANSGQATQMVLMGDGRILIAGTQSIQYNNVWSVARFLPNGAPDPTLNGTGVVAMGNIGSLSALSLQENAKILLAGAANSGVAWARLNSDGSSDITFGNNGQYAWGTISGWNTNPALAEDGAGRIITAGSIYSSNTGHDLIVARFQNGTRGNLSGSVFNDANNNGIRDAGEGGLFGVTVYLDANNNGTLDPGELSATTDASGNYTFNNVLQETWTVRQVAPAGDAQTNPVGYGASVVLLDGRTVTAPAFGDVAVASVPMNLDYLLTLTRHFGQPGTFATGDLDGDGTVNLADFLLLVRSYGKPLAPATTVAASSFLARPALRRIR